MSNCKKMSKFVIKSFHQKLSSKVVIKNFHQKLSSKIVIKNVSKVTSLWNRSLKVLSNCTCIWRCLLFWSGHVSSSLWSNVSKVTSLLGHSVVLWTLWLLVLPDRRTKGQGHLVSCSGQLKTLKVDSEKLKEKCIKNLQYLSSGNIHHGLNCTWRASPRYKRKISKTSLLLTALHIGAKVKVFLCKKPKSWINFLEHLEHQQQRRPSEGM